jgi:hypothetical protein
MAEADGVRRLHKQQAALRDERSGTYDGAGSSRSLEKGEAQTAEHERAQPGADVRQGVPGRETAHSTESDLPEGLQRARKGPYDKKYGRNEEPSHVPGKNPKRDDRA